MQVTRSKPDAVAIALGYLITAIVVSGWNMQGVPLLCVLVSLPLALIWFPDEIAEATRIAAEGGHSMNSETPALMVSCAGGHSSNG